MKSYEDTRDSNEREPSPDKGPDYPDEVSCNTKLIVVSFSN